MHAQTLASILSAFVPPQSFLGHTQDAFQRALSRMAQLLPIAKCLWNREVRHIQTKALAGPEETIMVEASIHAAKIMESAACSNDRHDGVFGVDKNGHAHRSMIR